MKMYREWDEAIAKNKLEQGTLKRDVSGLKYARKHSITYVYVDVVTGEIMQFGYSKNKAQCDYLWRDMFPHRYMLAMRTSEYDDITKDKETL